MVIGNEIAEINGLELCSSLTHLSLAKNKITTINGLGMLPIKILCLVSLTKVLFFIEVLVNVLVNL